MKWITIFVMFLLYSGLAAGFACVSYQDCPIKDCAGHVRQCIDNICIEGLCIIPEDSKILPRENVESFKESVKGFEEGINLSYRTKNPSTIKNNILGSLGLQQVLLLLLKGLGIFFIALITALLLVFAKSKGLLKFIVLGLVLAVAVLGIIVVIRGGLLTKKDWSGMNVADFEADNFKPMTLTGNQMHYISARLLDGTEYHTGTGSNEASILVLEMDNKDYLKAARLNLGGDSIIFMKEEILSEDIGRLMRYYFDEDRFIFIITANPDYIKDITARIIGNYPLPPTKTRLFSTDMVPPFIRIIRPGIGLMTNSPLIEFSVSDSESGVNEQSIMARNLNGKPRCIAIEDGYQCTIASSLLQGRVDYLIEAYDNSGNIQETQGSFIFDNTSIMLHKSEPTQGGYTSSKRLYAVFADDTTGIKKIHVVGGTATCNESKLLFSCRINAVLIEGANTVLIETEDLAGNIDIINYRVNLDTAAPVILKRQYSFEVSDEGMIEEILVNREQFNLNRCSKRESTYFCSSGIEIEEIMAIDAAGNIALK